MRSAVMGIPLSDEAQWLVPSRDEIQEEIRDIWLLPDRKPNTHSQKHFPQRDIEGNKKQGESFRKERGIQMAEKPASVRVVF